MEALSSLTFNGFVSEAVIEAKAHKKLSVLYIVGDRKDKNRYFFCKKRTQENRIKISSGDGYWKPIGKERRIIAYGKRVGIRRTPAFYETNKSSSKTRWIITEYCLSGFASTKVFEEWAVTHHNVYEKKGSKGRRQRKSNDEEAFTIESDHETGPPPPSPPTSADESESSI